jgi:hypothetical protein
MKRHSEKYAFLLYRTDVTTGFREDCNWGSQLCIGVIKPDKDKWVSIFLIKISNEIKKTIIGCKMK